MCCSNCGYAHDKLLFETLARIEAAIAAGSTSTGDPQALARIETVLSNVQSQLGVLMQEMDDLKASVAKLVTDVDTEIAEIQAGSATLHTALDAANAAVADLTAGQALSAAQIADLQAQLEAAKTAAVEINAAVNGVDNTVTKAGENLGVPLPPAVPVDQVPGDGTTTGDGTTARSAVRR